MENIRMVTILSGVKTYSTAALMLSAQLHELWLWIIVYQITADCPEGLNVSDYITSSEVKMVSIMLHLKSWTSELEKLSFAILFICFILVSVEPVKLWTVCVYVMWGILLIKFKSFNSMNTWNNI